MDWFVGGEFCGCMVGEVSSATGDGCHLEGVDRDRI